jgi:predicted DNA binding protein
LIQFQFLAKPENWIGSLCHDGAAVVKVLGLKPVVDSEDGSVSQLVEISSETSSAEVLSAKVKGEPSVVDSDLAKLGANRIFGSVTSKGCGVCLALVDNRESCFVAPSVTGVAGEHCEMSYNLFLSGRGLPILLQRLTQQNISYRITDVSHLSSNKMMTSRQEHVLKSALELGFYDFPKRIDFEALSTALKASGSTLSEILRRAEKKIIVEYFAGRDAH